MTLLALLLVLLPQELRVDGLVQGVVRTYGRMADFSATFEQISTDSSNQRQVSRGLLYLSRNGKKMRFEYQTPERKSYYSDGKTFTMFLPVAGQAIQQPVGKADDERLEIFQVLVGGQDWVRQYPRREEPPDRPLVAGNRLVRRDLPVVLLEVDPRRFWLHRFELTYTGGERTEFRFSDVRTARLDPALFAFTAPPGVDVIRER
jgi:outer membrane lipoprotein-sorting protein